MRNIRLVIAYHGAGYSGWQIQPNVPTVQGAIEKRVMAITCAHTRVRGAGRTDAGVHAAGQVANFYTESTVSTKAFFRGLNSLLPTDISIRSVEEVPLEFDARRFNRGKHYRYSIWNAPSRQPMITRYAWHRYAPLDDGAMAKAAQHLVGEHDFNAYRAADCDRNHAVRHLWRVDVTRHPNQVWIDVEGTAFLKQMVRNIVGSLVNVGSGKKPPEWIAEVLASRDRSNAGPTAPARGLCLEHVYFPELGDVPPV